MNILEEHPQFCPPWISVLGRKVRPPSGVGPKWDKWRERWEYSTGQLGVEEVNRQLNRLVSNHKALVSWLCKKCGLKELGFDGVSKAEKPSLLGSKVCGFCYFGGNPKHQQWSLNLSLFSLSRPM